MTRYLIASIIAAFFLNACSPKEKKPADVTGVWQNTTHWDNNAITLTVYPDSMMLFKAEKSFCPGTKFFISVGKWHIENDSILVMQQYNDDRHYEVEELFPELAQVNADSNNVYAIGVEARLIIRDSLLLDISPEGKAVNERNYRKTGPAVKAR